MKVILLPTMAKLYSNIKTYDSQYLIKYNFEFFLNFDFSNILIPKIDLSLDLNSLLNLLKMIFQFKKIKPFAFIPQLYHADILAKILVPLA